MVSFPSTCCYLDKPNFKGGGLMPFVHDQFARPQAPRAFVTLTPTASLISSSPQTPPIRTPGRLFGDWWSWVCVWCMSACARARGRRDYPSRFAKSTHLDLTLRHPQRIGQASPLGSRQVFRLFESLLQGEYLLARERGSGVFSLPVFVQQNGSLICENM